MQDLVDKIVEMEIARRVKSGALCNHTNFGPNARTPVTKTATESERKSSPAAQKVLDDAYRRVREGNITQVTPVKQASSTSKSTIAKSWINWDNQFNGGKRLEEQPNKQLKEASVDGIPASFAVFQRFQAGITSGSPGPNTEPKGKILSASEQKMPASWINYRRLIDGL